MTDYSRIQWFKATINIYYLTFCGGQDFGNGSVVHFWLRVSHRGQDVGQGYSHPQTRGFAFKVAHSHGQQADAHGYGRIQFLSTLVTLYECLSIFATCQQGCPSTSLSQYKQPKKESQKKAILPMTYPWETQSITSPYSVHQKRVTKPSLHSQRILTTIFTMNLQVSTYFDMILCFFFFGIY